ncbi:MAG: polysaccharide biosynthesis protein, partial [Candidatus Doudnabacteria bacterium]|nr:polysaccharide biosynthesis protein [Candidatus Doudnabacteria bacterium]
IIRLYLPRLFTVDLSQVVLLLASLIGSRLAVGSISVFSLGFDIQAMPVGVFAFAVATAAFPYLAEYFGAEDEVGFAHLLRESVVRILFYMMPVAVALLLMRAQAVRILYGAGQFGWEDTIATFEVLGVLAFSLAGQSLMPLFSRALLARRKTWAPVGANIVSMIITIMFGYWLAPMHGITGVAAAYVIGVTCNAGLLYILLRSSLAETKAGERALHVEENALANLVSKIIVASACFGVALYGGLYGGALVTDTHTWLGLVLQSLIASACGGVVYLLVSAVSGLPDAKYVVAKLVSKK